MGSGASGLKRSGSSNVVSAIHITAESNVDSILNSDFDVSKSGSGAGDTWGSGIYFTNGDLEKTFYSYRLSSSSGVEASIDTSQMFTADLGSGGVKSTKSMYDTVASQLPDSVRAEYKKYYKNTGGDRGDALAHVISNHYTGLIIKQEQPSGLDPLSGGNQIVVYDKSVIRSRKRWNK